MMNVMVKVEKMKIGGDAARKKSAFESMMEGRQSARENREEEREAMKAQKEKEDKKREKKVEKLKKSQMSIKMMMNWLDTGQSRKPGKKPDDESQN